MPQRKGSIPWNKGIGASDVTRKKMSNARLGVEPWNKGKTNVYSKEALYKIGSANRGKPMKDSTKLKLIGLKQSKETCLKRSRSLIGHKHSDESKKKMSENSIKTPGNSKFDRLLHRSYGINFGEKEYNDLILSQNSLCKICNRPETAKRNDKIKRLSIDHDHKTGKVRGLLCHKCNLILGHSEDSIEVLERSIKYLKDNL